MRIVVLDNRTNEQAGMIPELQDSSFLDTVFFVLVICDDVVEASCIREVRRRTVCGAAHIRQAQDTCISSWHIAPPTPP